MNQNQLKLRVWHREFNKFLSFGNEWFLDLDGNLYFNDVIDRVSAGLYTVDKNLYVIQRWTGLKDKNNKEIYEGDILRYNNFKNYEVEYDEYLWTLRNFDCYGFDEISAFQSGMEKIEIVGNIFENPELLHSPTGT